LKIDYPELYSFAKNKEISGHNFLSEQHLPEPFFLPLSSQAFHHLQTVQSFKDHFPLTVLEDKWTIQLGVSSVSRTYNFLIGHRQTPQIYKGIWDCFSQPRHKVFFWLPLKDRLSTRNILRRKNMHLDSYNCVLCPRLTEETVQHLFLGCLRARTMLFHTFDLWIQYLL